MQAEVLTTFTILHEYGSENGICLSVINAVELAHSLTYNRRQVILKFVLKIPSLKTNEERFVL